MRRPFRRYSFVLAERLGKTVQELHHELNSAQILEWLAFDKTRDEDWLKEYNKEQELLKSQEMSRDEYVAALKTMFGLKE